MHYELIARAIRYLVDNSFDQPGLAEVAAAIGMSEFHLQRTFSQWAGVSPKQFLQFLTKQHAKSLLRNASVFETALASGLSSPSRLHDLMVTHESITPGDYKSYGKGLQIGYGVHSSPFGYCFVAVTERGVCKLAFFDQQEEYENLLCELNADWKQAAIEEDISASGSVISTIFAGASSLLSSQPSPQSSSQARSIKVLLKGTPFRLLVWEALLRIPCGKLASYQQVARAIGKPSAVRAVASAVASNDIGYLIPCHRVIRESGALSAYRWGTARKAALLGWESSVISDA